MKLMITTIVLLLCALNVRADTLTLRNNGELNGRVQYDNEAFTITAKYSDQSITLSFDRKEVMSVEFNSRESNPGKPHSDISVFEITKGNTHDASDEQKHRPMPRNKATQAANDKVAIFEDKSSHSDDVLWFKDHSRLNGRIVQLRNGILLLNQQGKSVEIKVQQIATILVAPE